MDKSTYGKKRKPSKFEEGGAPGDKEFPSGVTAATDTKVPVAISPKGHWVRTRGGAWRPRQGSTVAARIRDNENLAPRQASFKAKKKKK